MSRKFSLFLSLTVVLLTVGFSENKQVNKKVFESFTGKIIGNKVRLRTAPDLDNSFIIRELNKSDHLLVIGDNNDFWSVRPPEDIKVYVFRSYVLDNIVEAERVNVRLYPNKEAPIVMQLQTGEKIQATPCKENNKWLVMSPPEKVHFYVSKEFLTNVGDKHYLAKITERKTEVENLLNSAFFLTQQECKKPFNEMRPQDATMQFEAIISSYTDFPLFVEQAKEGLALLQDNYLQKKIAYLEERDQLTEEQKKEIFSQMPKIQKKIKNTSSSQIDKTFSSQKTNSPMQKWLLREKELFTAWNSYHPDKSVIDFYKEQEVNAIILEGTLDYFAKEVNNKPGDYLLKNINTSLPIAFLYSTKVNMGKFVGKKVSVVVSPRPNNNFAFPAYFVSSIR